MAPWLYGFDLQTMPYSWQGTATTYVSTNWVQSWTTPLPVTPDMTPLQLARFHLAALGRPWSNPGLRSYAVDARMPVVLRVAREHRLRPGTRRLRRRWRAS